MGLEKVSQKLPASLPPSQHTAAVRNPTPSGRKQSMLNQLSMKELTLGSWNVRTLLDRQCADIPGRRTALVTKELSRYKIDIAALSETRFSGQGEITEPSTGYTIFRVGVLKANAGRRA